MKKLVYVTNMEWVEKNEPYLADTTVPGGICGCPREIGLQIEDSICSSCKNSGDLLKRCIHCWNLPAKVNGKYVVRIVNNKEKHTQFEDTDHKKTIINEFENQATHNFKKQQEELSSLSITEVIRAYDYINQLSNMVDSNNEVLDDKEEILQPLLRVINNCKVDKTCPHCGADLYLSDLPQYDFVCYNCEENF